MLLMLIVLLLWRAPAGAAGVAPTGKPHIIILSSRFTLTINTSTCTAAATVGGRSSSAVPFLALYNPPAADQAHNFEPCVSAELLADRRTIRAVAAHDLGHIDIAYNVSIAGHVYFTVKDISNWHADPNERHLQFGTFWAGLLDNSTAPVIMGKLQGPRGIPGTGTLSAGFVTVTENAYYRWIFGATVGDELAFGFAGPSSLSVCQLWQGVGAERGLLSHNANRFLSWFWTQMTEKTADAVATRAAVLGVQTIVLLSTWASPGQELVVSKQSFPSGVRKTVDHVMAKYGIKVGIHMHPDIVWPCIGTTSLHCLTSGIGKAPMVTDHLEGLVPEGLAPTFRSGSPPGSSGHMPSEDLGFWWGHDPEFITDAARLDNVARNGNPKPCGQGTCNPAIDWTTNDWGPDIALRNTSWLNTGVYRGGLSIGFDGVYSVGTIDTAPTFDNLRDEITLGFVLHPNSGGAPNQVLFARSGVFVLSLSAGQLRWEVNTTRGSIVARGNTTLSTSALASHVVKCTYNATSGRAQIFLSSKLDGISDAVSGTVLPQQIVRYNGIGPALWVGDDGSGAHHFNGSIEEIYLKNVSAEHREAYLFADDNRMGGSFLIDLTRPAGQRLFASAVNSVINQANISAVEYDGMEKLELMSPFDFAHSLKTTSSGVFRGPPAPDFFSYQGWPLRVGIGMVKALEMAHAGMNPATAVETTGIAPGLGRWRPDMSAYVDEWIDRDPAHVPNGFIALGLEWHGKMLQRVELTGTAINPYNTGIDSSVAACQNYTTSAVAPHSICSLTEVDYWFGGLVATGVAPQPMGNQDPGQFDVAIGKWLQMYAKYGHFQEESIQTLHWDDECCHVQGICEWNVCEDIVVTGLAGGTTGTTCLGVYAGASVPALVPTALMHDNSTILLFQAFGVAITQLSLGSPEFRSLRVAVLSSDTNLTLTGGFFQLHNQNVQLTVVSESGVLVQPARQLWPAAQTGAMEWHSREIELKPGAERLTYVFEKA